MHRLLIVVRQVARREDGQDLLEYGLVTVLIGIGALVAVQAVGNVINTVWWQYIAQTL